MFDLFGKKAAARYQGHKDALDAGAKMLATYGRGTGDGTWFDLAALPLEYREEVARRLDNIRAHVETTLIPAQLGNEDLFRELLEDVTLCQMVFSGQVPAAGRQTMRALTFSEVFSTLAEATEAFEDADRLMPMSVETFEALIARAKEARAWFKPGERHAGLKISPADAAETYQRARAALAKRKSG